MKTITLWLLWTVGGVIGMIIVDIVTVQRNENNTCEDYQAQIQQLSARLGMLEQAPRVMQVERLDLSVYPVERIPYQKVKKP